MNFSVKFPIMIIGGIAAASLLVNACRKSTFGKGHTTPMAFVVPDGFPQPVYDFTSHPVTEEGFALGRKLFHDSRLSSHIDVTCASCHQQHAAYTTFDHDLGHGTNHQHTTRNVPVIFNMAWHREFQWDGKTDNLRDQPLTCLTASEKMGEQVGSVVAKLDTVAEYRTLFTNAYGDDRITGDRIADAITQFVVMLVSADSKYDSVKKGLALFNSSEQAGYDIFRSKCATCHAEPLFTDLSFRNNGLPLNPNHPDLGRMTITGNRADSMKFKVPTLRNVGLTGYYAHDGRFVAMSQMLRHYSTGNMDGPTVDPSLRTNIPLSELDIFYLQEFMLSLSDSTLVNNPRFQ